jgi:hypothetical protein
MGEASLKNRDKVSQEHSPRGAPNAGIICSAREKVPKERELYASHIIITTTKVVTT